LWLHSRARQRWRANSARTIRRSNGWSLWSPSSLPRPMISYDTARSSPAAAVRGWSQGPAVGPSYCSCTVSSPALAGSAVEFTINTNFTHSCLRVHRGLCWCQCVLFREKRLKLVTVNRRECDRQLFWSVDIVKYWYANSISGFESAQLARPLFWLQKFIN